MTICNGDNTKKFTLYVPTKPYEEVDKSVLLDLWEEQEEEIKSMVKLMMLDQSPLLQPTRWRSSFGSTVK